MPIKLFKYKFTFILVLVALIANASPAKNKHATKGNIYLTKNNLDNSPKILLHGEWLFFADTLLNSNEVDIDHTENYKTIPVPTKRSFLDGSKYGTYYLNIHSDTNSDWLELNTLTIYSSAAIYINGDKVGEIGNPSTTIENNQPGLIFRSKAFKLNKGDNQLIVQFANFHREKSGLANSFFITSPEQKLRSSVIQIIKYAIILGTIFFIIFSQINYYFIRKKSVISLYFALAALAIFFYITFMSIYHVGNFLGDYNPNFNITLKFWRLSYYATVAFFPLYIYHLFSQIFYKPVIVLIFAYCIFSALITLIFPLHISSLNFNAFMYFTIFVCLFSAGVGITGVIKKIEFSRLFILGFVFFILTVVNDILHNLLIIRSVNLLDVGIFGMMLTQTQIINRLLSKTITKNEKLTTHLTFVNNNLEGIVKRRTREIEDQKSEIETQRDHVENQNTLILQHTKTITDSINYAREIQRAVLPEQERLKEYFEDSFILYKPKDFVSGDFYWIRQITINQQKHLLFCVADCTGHGVPGALLSMLGMTLLNEITNKDQVKNTSEILEKLRQRFKETLSNRTDYKVSSDGMHITFCMVNQETNTVHYSGAFQSLFHIHNNELKRLKGTRSIIGNYIQEKAFEETTFQLEKGDRLYMFTDGFVDQFSGKGSGRFMQKELLKLLVSYDKMPFAKQKEHLNYEFEAWRGDFEQIDDVLVMGLKA